MRSRRGSLAAQYWAEAEQWKRDACLRVGVILKSFLITDTYWPPSARSGRLVGVLLLHEMTDEQLEVISTRLLHARSASCAAACAQRITWNSRLSYSRI